MGFRSDSGNFCDDSLFILKSKRHFTVSSVTT
ncbi:protein of unknown function [Candidatus Methylocalor cossyra]|uniref:Uncharacterized protein n=1 Tax=Candidatus Methylocalor cossyra TaxID=3108543 RepID=A0ABM9NK29_9GAMM